jgi:hypothetical protein
VPWAGVLPASGTAVLLREPSGEEELLVLEQAGPVVATMLALAERLTTGPAGAAIDWQSLPAVELGAIALLIRAAWLGDTLRTDALCPAEGCGELIDIVFGVSAYLEHHRPRTPRGVTEVEPGWFAFAGTADVRFRIPTIADLALRTDASVSPVRVLERCIRPANPAAALVRRVDRALRALAPELDGELVGTCPVCGQTVDLRFEPISYVFEELRHASSGLDAQVHELAFGYHWSDTAILALSRRRRHAYATMVRGELSLA